MTKGSLFKICLIPPSSKHQNGRQDVFYCILYKTKEKVKLLHMLHHHLKRIIHQNL